MRFALRRLTYLVMVLLAVTLLTFLLLKLLPGDPAINILGPSATPQAIAQIHHHLGLDKPLPLQYLNWLGNALRGNLGKAYQNNQTTVSALRQRLPVTIELLIISQLLALIISIPVAIYAAYRPNRWFDRISTTTAFGLLSLPDFIVGVVLVLIFAVRLHWFPATGYTPISQNLFQNLRSMVLPCITLAVGELAAFVRLLRTDMIATLQEDYITMAKSKGMSDRHILLRHAFRPSSFSLVTVVGLNLGRLIGGTFIVETIFALPGIGDLAIRSIFSRDYLVVQGVVLVIAVGYVLANAAVELLYTVLDPRIRHAGAAV
jgi:peptide/nickel transport system permease protein